MALEYIDENIDTFEAGFDKPHLFNIDNSGTIPFERLSPRNFEDITYFTIKQTIEEEGTWNGFTEIQLLGGVRDKGRDCVIKRDTLNCGLIQCKHSERGNKLSKTLLLKDIIKFLLFSIKHPNLIQQIENFTYYIITNSGLDAQVNELLEDFNHNIIKESNLKKLTNNVLSNFASFKEFRLESTIHAKIEEKLSLIKVKNLDIKDLDILLHKSFNKNIIDKFFSIQKVVDTDEVLTELKEIKNEIHRELSGAEANTILNRVSYDFNLISNNFGPRTGTHIERYETKALLNWILEDLPKNKSNIAILEANAGLGKTVVLKDLNTSLNTRLVPVIPIKADKYYAEHRVSLEYRFFQDSKITFRKLVNTLEQEHQKIVIIIDQLDALSQTLSSERDFLITYNRLIAEFAERPGIRIIISIRTFDLNYDAELSQYKSNLYSRFLLKPLDKKQIRQVLTLYDIRNPSNDLLELLKVPSHLNTYCKLDHKGKYIADSIKSLNDLYDLLWTETLNKSKGLEVTALMNSIAQSMYERQQISVQNVYQDSYSAELKFLKSNGILIGNDKSIQFFHQSFYDYVFSKHFVQSGQSITTYILENGQSLYVRQTLKMVLEYLREFDHPKYIETIGKLLGKGKYRFHIKMLVITGMATTSEPSSLEEFVFKKYILSKPSSFELFIGSVFSSGWFVFLVEEGILDSLLLNTNTFQQRGIKQICNRLIKQVFKKKSNNPSEENTTREMLAFRLLRNNISYNQDLSITYLERFPDIDNKTNFIQRILIYIEDWKDERLLTLFDKYLPYVKEKNNQRDNFWFFQILEKAFPFHTEYVFDKFRPVLRQVFSQPTHSKSLIYEEKTLIEKMSQKAPNATSDFLYELMIEVIESNTDSSSYSDISECLYTSFNFNDGGIKSSVSEDADQFIFDMIASNMKRRIKNEAFFEKFIPDKLNENCVPVLRLVAILLAEDPEAFIEQIFQLISNVHNKGGFNGYDNRFQFYLRELIAKSFPYFKPDQKSKIIDILYSIKHPEESKIHEWKGVREHSLEIMGRKQYLFIKRIHLEEIKKERMLYRRFQELRRKFGDIHEELLDESRIRFGTVTAPMTRGAYENMSLDAWEKSMKKYDDDFKNDKFLKGGKLEHSRAFEENVKQNPEKYYPLVVSLLQNKEISLDYSVAGVSGLIEAKYDPNKVLDLFKLLMKHEHDLSRTLRLIWLSDYFINQEVADQDVLDFLCQNALNHPNPDKVLNPDHLEVDSMNTVRGAALRKVIHYYTHKEFKEQIFTTVEQAKDDLQPAVQVSILANIAWLNHLDLERAFDIFCHITEECSNEVFVYSFWSADHFMNKFFDRMNFYFDRIIENDELHKKGTILIAKAWLNKNKYRGSEQYLKRISKKGPDAIHAILDVAEKNLFAQGKLNPQCLKLLEKYLAYDNDDIAQQYSAIILREAKPDNFIELYSFLSAYAQSYHAAKSPAYFFKYLIRCSGRYPRKCLKLIKYSLKYDKPDIQRNGYFDKEPVQVVLAIYTSFAKNLMENKIYARKSLDLFDKMLQLDHFRSHANEALNKL